MPRLAVVVTPLLVWSLWAPASSVAESAQDARGDSPAHISVVDGAASLERDGQSESAPASMPLLAGDRIRTQNGRVEILFDDGSTLHLDGNTLVDFQSDEVVRLLGGRVRLNILGAGAASSHCLLPRRRTIGMGPDRARRRVPGLDHRRARRTGR